MKPYLGFVTSRGPQGVSSVDFLEGALRTSSTITLTNFDIGAAHPLRKIVIVLGTLGINISVPTCTVGGVSATARANYFRNTGSIYMIASVFEKEVPTGTTSTIVVNYPAGVQEFGYGVYRVVGGEFISANTNNATSQEYSLAANSALLSTLSSGTGGTVPDEITWGGANKDLEVEPRYTFGDSSKIFTRASFANRYAASDTGTFNLTTTGTPISGIPVRVDVIYG